MERIRIVLVDDEVDLLHSLERKIGAALPGASLRAHTDPSRALEDIQAEEPALVITDVRMPGLSGLELLFYARQRWPALPFVVMTAYPTESMRREAQSMLVHYIEKPFPAASLLALIETLLARRATAGFSGAVSSATLPDLIQLFFMSGSTGALRVWHGDEHGTLGFDRGALVQAAAGPLAGREAIFEMVAWEGGQFSMDLAVVPGARNVEEGTTGLILEALRRADERRSGRVTGDLPAGEDGADDDIDLGVSEARNERGDRTTMATNLQLTFEKLRAVDGYIGAAVVDSESAMSLGSDGGGTFLNLEVAAAGNAEVVRAKRKAIRALGLKDEIEDILITLGKQYHLIRPMRSRPGVFLYLALERSRANLAMARLVVADAEKLLEL